MGHGQNVYPRAQSLVLVSRCVMYENMFLYACTIGPDDPQLSFRPPTFSPNMGNARKLGSALYHTYLI